MARITGRIEVVLNGNLLLNKAGAEASGLGLSGEPNFELKEVVGDTGLHGFVEEPVMAQCDVTVSDRDDISLDTIARIRENGTVIFRAAGGGKVYTMNQATCKRNFTLTGGEGETKLIFVGPNWIESTEAVS
jgi:hypothetical protein